MCCEGSYISVLLNKTCSDIFVWIKYELIYFKFLHQTCISLWLHQGWRPKAMFVLVLWYFISLHVYDIPNSTNMYSSSWNHETSFDYSTFFLHTEGEWSVSKPECSQNNSRRKFGRTYQDLLSTRNKAWFSVITHLTKIG